MPVGPLFDLDSFSQRLALHMREELEKAAEPLIQQTLKDVETTLRARLAEMVVGFIDTSYDLMRDGRDLRIQVRLGNK